MRSKWFVGTIGLLLILFALFTVGSIPSMAAPPESASLHLKAGVFAPAQTTADPVAEGNGNAYYIIQFAGPIEQNWKDDVSATGAQILDYIPDFAFKVRMNPAQLARVSALKNVAWVGNFEPAFRISPDIASFTGSQLFRVRVEQGADAGQTTAAIAQSGAQVVRRTDNILLVAADTAQLEAMSKVMDVAWVEPFRMPERHNEYGAGVITGANVANANGYNGSTQTVAVADTGLGGGTATTAHADIPSGRITALYDWASSNAAQCYRAYPNGVQDVDSGHGTHVAVSVLGDGGVSGEGRGTAPAAHLVFQAVEDYVDMYGVCASYPDGYYLLGLPDDIRQLFQQAYNAGARIHSNSWGSAAAGDYTVDSANADNFIWNNPDMVITFSAGNEGIDANADGVIDNDSIGSPATAKNVITVGASENDRQGHWECDASLSYTTCAAQGGQNSIFTWGGAWPNDYPAAPLFGDSSAGNAQQMAAFSSRGPTDDGRIKPDIVAPGSWILSGYSDMYQQGYDGSANPRNGAWQYDGYGFPMNAQYKYLSGTSMSNPLVAGGAAVVRDFYQKAYGYSASAALVKATLINSAVDLADENNDGSNDNDFPIPNIHEGWGLMNLIAATDGTAQYVDNTTGLSTNGTAVYQYTHNGNAPFKVTLVWSDYASTETAVTNLVNDLDLIVTAPNGTVYKGNVFSGGWTQTGGSADRTNNVENVYVQNAAAGTWTVQVSAYNIPNGPQKFALVADGASAGTPQPTPTPASTSTPAPTSTPPAPTATPAPTSTPAPTAYMHVGDLDGSATSGSRNRWNAAVTITIHNATDAPLANATVNGSWSGSATGSASCVTNASGQCTVSKSNLKGSNITFTVTSVTHSTNVYQSSANHDPDGDSTGTAITVVKP